MPIFGWGKKKKKDAEKEPRRMPNDGASVEAATQEYREAVKATKRKPHSAGDAAALIRARKKRRRAIMEEMDRQ